MPFLTEELWHQLPQSANARSIALAQFPAPAANWIDESAEREMSQIQEIIAAARNLRAELKLDPRKPMAADMFAANPKLRALAEANIAAIRQFAALSALNFVSERMNPADGALRSTSEFDLRIPYEAVTDVPAELANLRKEKDRLEGIINGQEKQLGNPAFSGKAPAAVIAKLQESLAERKTEHAKITRRISQLDGTARGTPPA